MSAVLAEELAQPAPARIGPDSYLLGVALFLLIAAAVMDAASAQAAILVSVGILLTASAIARFAVPVQGGSVA